MNDKMPERREVLDTQTGGTAFPRAYVEALEARLAAAVDLLRVANCGTCGNTGGYMQQVSEEDAELQQCEWCWHRSAAIAGSPPNSGAEHG